MLTSEPASSVSSGQRRVDLADPLDLSPELVSRDVGAEAHRRRVVGDRQVLVAGGERRRGHLLDRGGAVGRGRVAVQVALEVGGRDELREGAVRAPPRARRGPRAAPVRCRPSRAARRPPASVAQRCVIPVLSSSTPYSETCRPRRTAKSRSATLCSLEPVRCWSTLPNWSGSTIRTSTLTPLCVRIRTAFVPGVEAASTCGSAGHRRGQRAGIGRRRDDVEVLDGLGHAPRRAGELGVLGHRVRADLRQQLLADRERPAAARSAAPVPPARRPSTASSSACSALAPKPLSSLMRPAVGGFAQALERVDAELLVADGERAWVRAPAAWSSRPGRAETWRAASRAPGSRRSWSAPRSSPAASRRSRAAASRGRRAASCATGVEASRTALAPLR